MRPLTIFVGPSNTGKTYFAILVYALRRILRGFPRLPVIHPSQYHSIGLDRRADETPTDEDALEEDVLEILSKIEAHERPFSFGDLPIRVRQIAESTLNDPNLLGAILSAELQRCFDLDSVPELIGSSGSANMSIALETNESRTSLWHFEMEVSESNVSTLGRIEDIVILPAGITRERSAFEYVLEEFEELGEEDRGVEAFREIQNPADLLEQLIHPWAASWRDRTHYLPAARSGIMQSHRVIASSLVARSTRGGPERFPELPTFSGVMADFMQKLILIDEGRGRAKSIRDIADALESNTLAGEIATRTSQVGGYPEFVYRPLETKRDIRLTRASSMVSELAPVVLFLRGAISPGDMLIIEEPEAHLHPAAQTQIAGVLASLVRERVQVVVTTHSDWLLKEIGNLIREGEIGEKTNDTTRDSSSSNSLLPSDVGVWLFRRDSCPGGSTVVEIPFDRSEGVEPEDYEDVAEALYNRSADLQNQSEELAGAANRED